MRFETLVEKIKRDILGQDYSLSLAFVSAKKSQEINKQYRGKDKPTNILSFSLRKNEGEILLCKPVIRKEAKNFGKTFDGFLGFLVIHGMLHLKGCVHGATMERLELKYDQKYFSRHRSRLVDDTRSRRRILKGRKKS